MGEVLAYARQRGRAGPAKPDLPRARRDAQGDWARRSLREEGRAVRALGHGPAPPVPMGSWIDIEGGVGVLMSYANKGRRELPNGHRLSGRRPQGTLGPVAVRLRASTS